MTTSQKVRAARRALRQIMTDLDESFHDPYTTACGGEVHPIIIRHHAQRAIVVLRTLRLPRVILFEHLERLTRVETTKRPDDGQMPWGPTPPEAYTDLTAADSLLG